MNILSSYLMMVPDLIALLAQKIQQELPQPKKRMQIRFSSFFTILIFVGQLILCSIKARVRLSKNIDTD